MCDPNSYLCGCPRVEGQRQCKPCHNAQNRARRRGEPVKFLRPRVDTHFTCGHPRIPVNCIGGGTRAFPKGRCRYCRSGVLTFDLATGEPFPGALVPAESPRGMALPDEKIIEVQRRLAAGESKASIVERTSVSKTTVYRIARGVLKPNGAPPKRQHYRFELVEVRPLPTAFESTAGRSYQLAPLRSKSA